MEFKLPGCLKFDETSSIFFFIFILLLFFKLELIKKRINSRIEITQPRLD